MMIVYKMLIIIHIQSRLNDKKIEYNMQQNIIENMTQMFFFFLMKIQYFYIETIWQFSDY